MKRLVIGGVAAALIAGGAGMSFAGQGGVPYPYPNGNNDYGLCTADAHHKNGDPAPFTAMKNAYNAAHNNDSSAWDNFCQGVLAGDGSPGNSEHGHGHGGS